ncbi:MAG: condensation domain-containing protein, partial [Lautropia sp.]|nr:condensation domain-containing protein [Lautropia sp.]
MLWQLAPNSSAYHLGGGLRFVGELDVRALSASLDMLIDRHASLRTVFGDDGHGQIEQLILPSVPGFRLQQHDLRHLSPDEASRCLDEFVQDLVDEAFDLTQGPLLRAALYRLGASEWRLMIVMHHIISDAQSTAILLQELATIYQAKVSGRKAVQPALPVDYIDYAHWQREWLANEGKEQLDWWRKELAEASAGTLLPTDHPRTGAEILQAARYCCRIEAAEGSRLRSLAHAQGCTLFVVLLAAWQWLLARHGGDDVIQIGLPVANRNRAEVADVVGFFVNTLVFRTDIRPDVSLREYLDQVREKSLLIQTHQDVPLDRLVEVLKPDRHLGQNPFFQVMFNHLRGNDRQQASWQGVSVEWFDVPERHAQFELTLQTRDMADGSIELDFIHARDLFESARIERMAADYQRLLQSMLKNLDTPLGEIRVVDESCYQQLREWGCNPGTLTEPMPVQQLIEKQASCFPDRIALVFGDESLSYRELNQRANQLAHHLIGLGVGPEVRVGIALERSIEMVVGLLAILKTGGAYVPLDPEYPADRLWYMIEDSGIGLLLTQTRVLSNQFKEGLETGLLLSDPLVRGKQEKKGGRHGVSCGNANLRVLLLDDIDISRHPSSNPDVVVHDENLAYVIYTSGSTGRPKGAANRHRALSNRLMWMQSA